MSLITIDSEKCKRDGICVRECPAAIIKLKDKESLPQLVKGGEDFCLHAHDNIRLGHGL